MLALGGERREFFGSAPQQELSLVAKNPDLSLSQSPLEASEWINGRLNRFGSRCEHTSSGSAPMVGGQVNLRTRKTSDLLQ